MAKLTYLINEKGLGGVVNVFANVMAKSMPQGGGGGSEVKKYGF